MKNLFYKFLISFLFTFYFSFLTSHTIAQNLHCGSTEARQELIKSDPDLLKRYEAMEHYTREYIAEHKNEKSDQLYIIPIVFHVIHEYGPENISDQTIYAEVTTLNRDYKGMDAQISQVISQFVPIIANCNFEFRLAKIDPQGNCTSGIDRVYSNRTNYGDEFSKLNSWDRSKYLNVWVVKKIGQDPSPTQILAYAHFPSDVEG